MQCGNYAVNMMQRIRWAVVALGLVSVAGLVSLRAADAPAAPATLRVGVYDGQGTSGSLENLLKALDEFQDLHVRRLSAEAIRSGELGGVQVLIHPGGSGSRQGDGIGSEGRLREQAFVRDGGGYVGICAGAYLATCQYTWSLHILDAKVLDRAHWARGFGPVDIGLTPHGREMLGVSDPRRTIYYHQGPLLAPAHDPDVPDYEELARFETEIARNGAPEGVMRGTTAIAAGQFGKGRVFCFSPHPERTDGLHELVHRAVVWAAGR